MPPTRDAETLLQAITEIALDLARLCPDCADRAKELVSLVDQLKTQPLDRGAMRDRLDAEVVDTDLPESTVMRAAEAVVVAGRDDRA